MAKDEQKAGNGDDNKSKGGYLKFSGMGFQMIAVIGIFTYIGYRIDEGARHNVQWVTATLALIGVFISLYLVIRAIKE